MSLRIKSGVAPIPVPQGWRAIFSHPDGERSFAVVAMVFAEIVERYDGRVTSVEDFGWVPATISGDVHDLTIVEDADRIVGPGDAATLYDNLRRLTRRLPESADPAVLALIRAEDALLAAGASPEVDYTWRELVQFAAAILSTSHREDP